MRRRRDSLQKNGRLRHLLIMSAPCVRGEMDITAAFEAAFGGSNPSGRTTKMLRFTRSIFVARRDSNGQQRGRALRREGT